MDVFQASSLLTFSISKTINYSSSFLKSSSILSFPAHSLVWILLLFLSFSVSFAVSSSLPNNCYNSSKLYPKLLYFLLYILRQSHLHHSFYYYLFLDDSQMSISSPDFSDLYIRISNYLLNSTRISPRHLKFIMFKTILMYSLFSPQTWSSSTTSYFSKSLPSLKFSPPAH